MGQPIGITVSAGLFGLFGVLGILAGIAVFALGAGFAAMMAGTGAEGAGAAGGIVGAIAGFVGVIALVGGILELAAAYGIWKHKGWGRILGSILAVISLLGIPIGTLIGAIILYFLWFHEETKKAFA